MVVDKLGNSFSRVAIAVRFVAVVIQFLIPLRGITLVRGPIWGDSLSHLDNLFSVYLKGLSKYRRMGFFFLKYLFSFQRY